MSATKIRTLFLVCGFASNQTFCNAHTARTEHRSSGLFTHAHLTDTSTTRSNQSLRQRDRWQNRSPVGPATSNKTSILKQVEQRAEGATDSGEERERQAADEENDNRVYHFRETDYHNITNTNMPICPRPPAILPTPTCPLIRNPCSW